MKNNIIELTDSFNEFIVIILNGRFFMQNQSSILLFEKFANQILCKLDSNDCMSLMETNIKFYHLGKKFLNDLTLTLEILIKENYLSDIQISQFRWLIRRQYITGKFTIKEFTQKYFYERSPLVRPITLAGIALSQKLPLRHHHMCDIILPVLAIFYEKYYKYSVTVLNKIKNLSITLKDDIFYQIAFQVRLISADKYKRPFPIKVVNEIKKDCGNISYNKYYMDVDGYTGSLGVFIGLTKYGYEHYKIFSDLYSVYIDPSALMINYNPLKKNFTICKNLI